MSKFFDRDSKPEKGEPTPHPDSQDNFNWLMKILDRIEYLPNKDDCPFRWEIQDQKLGSIFNHATRQYEHTYHYPDPKCVIFVWEERGKKLTRCISMHQQSRTDTRSVGFKEQVCAALNHCGQLHLLDHKIKPHWKKPSATDPDDKWGAFTPRR